MGGGVKMKRTVALLAIFALAFSLNSIAASAAAGSDCSENNGNQSGAGLLWVNATSISLNISYSGSTATCTGTIKGISTVNSIKATYTLKRVNSDGSLTTVKTWSNLSSSTSYLNFDGTYSTVSKGERYRLEVSATLTTTGGVKETVSDYIEKTY
jgi:hypothetical protein